MSVPVVNDLPNFHAWSYLNLANFATDAYIKLCQQEFEIQQLRLKLLEIAHEQVTVRKAN